MRSLITLVIRGKKFPLVLEVVALEEIERGDELCISYIKNDSDLHTRQEDLSNYGFTCQCTKCSREKGLSENDEVHANVFKCDDKVSDDFFGSSDDLFGSDEENSFDDNSSQSSVKLADRLIELDTKVARCSPIPISIMASSLAFVNQLASQLLQDLSSDQGPTSKNYSLAEIIELMECLLKFLGSRNFVGLCRVATQGEQLTLSILHKLEKWPLGTVKESHGCFSVASAICYAQSGNFLAAIEMLDKASIFGLPRNQIKDFFNYVELHLSRMSTSYCSTPIATVRDYSYERDLLEVCEVGLCRSIQYPVTEILEADFRSGARKSFGSEAFVLRKYAKWPAIEKWRYVYVEYLQHEVL